MTPLLEEDDLAAWRAFLDAHAAVIAVLERELLDERGLPLTFYDVLVHLSEAGGQMRMSDLAGSLLLSRSGVSRLVDRIAAAGYVTREACPSDKRGTYAAITRAGREALAASWPTHARGVRHHFADALKPGEARTLAAVLERVRAHAAGS
ncbi:MAG: MarR family winged helix-turn-helix transcriptional regulator [Acidimicrobiales bacterium]